MFRRWQVRTRGQRHQAVRQPVRARQPRQEEPSRGGGTDWGLNTEQRPKSVFLKQVPKLPASPADTRTTSVCAACLCGTGMQHSRFHWWAAMGFLSAVPLLHFVPSQDGQLIWGQLWKDTTTDLTCGFQPWPGKAEIESWEYSYLVQPHIQFL